MECPVAKLVELEKPCQNCIDGLCTVSVCIDSRNWRKATGRCETCGHTMDNHPQCQACGIMIGPGHNQRWEAEHRGFIVCPKCKFDWLKTEKEIGTIKATLFNFQYPKGNTER